MANELVGVKELTQKLNKLDNSLRVKSFRSVLFKATTPVVQQMKAKIPVGKEWHSTYKKKYAPPGYARSSIKRVTGKKYLSKGRLSIGIGVKADAFYAIRFYDQGPYTISKRRQQTNQKLFGHVGYRRRHINIKPYTLQRVSWFQSVFIANEGVMLSKIKSNLIAEVNKAVK